MEDDESSELARLVGAGQQEWRSFLEGKALSTGLLLKLLAYKYRKQKRTVRVNPQTLLVGREGNLVVPTPLSATSSLVEYELILVVYPFAEVKPTIALLIRTRSYPFTIFVPPSIAETQPLRLDYISNNSLVDPTSNGYFVFDFLTLFFKEGGSGEGWNERMPVRNQPRELADAMMEDLTRPLRIRRALIALYREMSTLLGEEMTNDMRRTVESKKQAFYRLVESVILARPMEEEEEEEEEEENFFELPQLKELDPVIGQATEEYSEDLFKELLSLLDFVLLVADTSSQAPPAPQLSLKRIDGSYSYTVDEIKYHIRHLVRRLLMRVDALNVPPLDDLMTQKLRFSQRDYDLLVGSNPFITYNIIAYTLLPSLDPKAILLGPRHAVMALSQRLVIKQERRLTLWVMEGVALGGQPYYTLSVVNQRPVLPCQHSIYMPSKEQGEMTRIRDDATEVLNKVGITCKSRQIEGTYNEATDDYNFTSWYVAFLIKSLSDRLGTEPIDSDWISHVRLILGGATLADLTDLVRWITRSVQRSILSLLYPAASSRQEAAEPHLDPTRELSSRVSDVARLSLREEFIDDQVITDVVASMPLERHCYVLDSNYWGGVIVRGIPKEILSVFKNPMIDTLLLPINQLNKEGEGYHWSLATINLASNLVTFYSSLCETGDPYYNTFRPLIRSFLAVQTPGVKYTINHLQGQEIQPQGSKDCALFVLDKISELCVASMRRRIYTRESVAEYLTKELVKLARQGKWSSFGQDICTLYVKRPTIWADLAKNPTLLSQYRDAYLRLLVRIIAKTRLYQRDSVVLLGRTIRSLKVCSAGTEIEALFTQLLKKKQERSIKKRPSSQEESPKCLIYDRRTLTLIDVLINQLNWYWNIYRGRSGQYQSFAEKYGQTISDDYLQELVVDTERRQAFLDALINTLLTKGGSRDALQPVICEYVVQQQK